MDNVIPINKPEPVETIDLTNGVAPEYKDLINLLYPKPPETK